MFHFPNLEHHFNSSWTISNICQTVRLIFPSPPQYYFGIYWYLLNSDSHFICNTTIFSSKKVYFYQRFRSEFLTAFSWKLNKAKIKKVLLKWLESYFKNTDIIMWKLGEKRMLVRNSQNIQYRPSIYTCNIVKQNLFQYIGLEYMQHC